MTSIQLLLRKWDGVSWGTYFDCTPYLMDNAMLSVTYEFERNRFERVAGDLRVEMSSLDSAAHDYFNPIARPDTITITLIVEGATVWRGLVDPPSVRLDVNKQLVSFDGYSLDRYLWDVLAVHKARNRGGYLGEYLNRYISLLTWLKNARSSASRSVIANLNM